MPRIYNPDDKNHPDNWSHGRKQTASQAMTKFLNGDAMVWLQHLIELQQEQAINMNTSKSEPWQIPHGQFISNSSRNQAFKDVFRMMTGIALYKENPSNGEPED